MGVLTQCQELAFELATIECDKAEQCPLVKKSKEVIKEIKKLVHIQKKFRLT